MGKRVTLNPLTNARRTTSASGESSTTYTTEETRVGIWIDGKTIYRQIIDIENPVTLVANQWRNIGIFIESPTYDSIISAKGWYKASGHGGGGAEYELLPLALRVNVDGIQVLQGIAPLEFQLDRVLIEYTKL